jgi:hypothetical protein
VFLNLVRELKHQGLSNKVIADMFGLALRTYHNRIQRSSESATFAGHSVWEAVLEYVRQHGPVTRAEVLLGFVNDDAGQVRAVLSDLVGSQLLVKTGRGDATAYRMATGDDRATESEAASLERVVYLVWVAVHRFGPIDREGLGEIVPAKPLQLDAALDELMRDGRVTPDPEDAEKLRADSYLIPVGSSAGWEAAVFDHYQAMVTALCIKLRAANHTSTSSDWVGGSTYCYDVWPGHPLHDEVAGLLGRVRDQARGLRERVEAYNEQHPRPAGEIERRFTAYVGQSLISDAPEDLGEQQ